MTQDERGYVFIATEYGLVKYNGSRFVPVCTNIPSRERVAYAFYKNKTGTQYFVNSQFHIYCIRNDSAFRMQIAGKIVPAIPHFFAIRQLFEDSTGNIYVSSHYEHFRYDAGTGKWISSGTPARESHTMFIEKLSDGYIRTYQGSKSNRIVVRNSRYKGTYNLPRSLNIGDPTVARETKDGLLIYGGRQLIRIGPTGQLLSYRTPGNILCLKTSANNHLWIGTQYNGLLELDSNLHLLRRYLPQLSVADVLFDNQEGVWVSTLEQGVFHCRNKHEYHYDNENGFSEEICILKTIGNYLFVGSGHGKLLVMGPEGNRTMAFGQHKMQDVIAWKQGYLVSNTRSVLAMDGSFRSRTVIPDLACYLMLHGADEFMCVSPSYIFFYSEDYRAKRTLAIEGNVKCLLPIGNDTFLAGSTHGVFQVGGKAVWVPACYAPLKNHSIADLERDTAGNIWIGTKGDGLFVLTKDRQLKPVPAPAEIITNVSLFRDSVLLVSTNTGLYAKSCAPGRTGWKTLYRGEVLNAVPFQHKLFAATKHGLVALDTARLLSTRPYPVYLSAVTATGRNIDKDAIVLDHRNRDVYFDFDLLAYDRQESFLYYRLEGPVSSKGQVSGRQLLLQNLAPGHYELRLYMGSVNGPPVLKVPIYIRPAFWQTTWFLILTIVAGLVLIVAVAYLLQRRSIRQAYRKAAITRTLSEYKLTALKAQINPHFISNALTAIQQLVLSDETDKAGSYLARFSQLIRQVLQYSDKSLVLLQEELNIIDLNVSLEQLRFDDLFHFTLDIEPGIYPHALYIPPLITQPFIENAIWHGLLPLNGRRRPRLVVSVRRKGDDLILSVIDNGVGRKASAKQAGFSNSAFASRGIELTESRIENLNQLYTAGKAHILIHDLFEQEEAAGTQVDIILPYLPDTIYDSNYQMHHRR